MHAHTRFEWRGAQRDKAWGGRHARGAARVLLPALGWAGTLAPPSITSAAEAAETAQQAAAGSAPAVSASAGSSQAASSEATPSQAGASGDGAAVIDREPDAGELLEPRVGKRWQLSAEAQYRSLLITDEDPANDRYMLYRLQGAYQLQSWLSVYAQVGLFQRFVSVEGESGLRLEDTVLGAFAEQSISLAPWERTLGLVHRLRILLPTSFQSQEQNLLLAAEWSTRARLRLVDQLFVGLRGTLHYRFHEYAEQAGSEGGTLPRFVAEALAFVEYWPLVSKTWGALALGAQVTGGATVDYPSLDPGSIDEAELPPGTLTADDLGGAGDSDSYVSPHYGYALYASYVPPIPHLSFTVSLEQAGSAVRYGEPRLYFIHRDQTEVGLRLSASF